MNFKDNFLTSTSLKKKSWKQKVILNVCLNYFIFNEIFYEIHKNKEERSYLKWC